MAGFFTAAARRDTVAALAAYDQLPERLQKARMVLLTRAQMLQREALDDRAVAPTEDASYLAALSDIAESWGDDPSLALVLLDYHVLREDYAAALDAVALSREQLPLDSALSRVEAGLALRSGNPDRAIEPARLAIELEPDDDTNLLTLLDTLVSSERYEEAVEVIARLRDEFDLELDPAMLDDPA